MYLHAEVLHEYPQKFRPTFCEIIGNDILKRQSGDGIRALASSARTLDVSRAILIWVGYVCIFRKPVLGCIEVDFVSKEFAQKQLQYFNLLFFEIRLYKTDTLCTAANPKIVECCIL